MSKYEIIYQENRVLHKVVVDDLSEIHKNTISINKLTKKEFRLFSFKNSKNIYNFFYELNTILQANLTILDAILILKKNRYDINTNLLIELFHNSLKNGQFIHKALENKSYLVDKLIIQFIKVGEINGNIKEAINSITIILEQNEKNKTKILKSFSYPIILSTSLLISIVSLFKFVIPKFETIYEKLEGNLPLSTQYLLYIKDLFDNYFGAFLLLCFISTYLFLFMCKKSTAFKENLDRFLLTKIPIVSKMFLVSNSSNFFFCLSTLLNDKYQFYDSLKNSKTLISNTYLYYKITQIEMDIKNGENISNAFDKSKLFDDLTIRLINTGEKSNKLALTVSKIDIIYKKKLDKILQNFITIFEPSIIAIMASLILWLVLAIFTPIWDIGTILK